MRCLISFCAAAGIAFPVLAQSTTCDADASGIETFTTLWESPRPVAMPASYSDRLSSTFLSLNVDPEGDLPREVAITPDGLTALVVNMGTLPTSGGSLSFIDMATRTVTGSVALGQLPVHVAVSPNGVYAAVPNVFSHTVSIVHVPTRTVLHTVPVTGTQPFRAAITPDSQFAVVSVTNNAINSAFSVIDLATGVEVRTIPSAGQGSIGGYATPEFAISGPLFTQFALTPDGTRIVLPYSATTGSALKIYSVATGAETSLAMPQSGRSIDISLDGTRAVVGHEGSTIPTRVISLFDLTTNTLLASHPVANQLGSQTIKITPDNTHAVAAISNNLIFVDLATGVTDATIFTGVAGELEILGNFVFNPNVNSSVINWTTRTLVTQITLAACVEAAVTPVGNKVVALNSRFREDANFYTIGAVNTADGFVASGPQPEGDCTKPLAITPDGETLIACNTISRSVSIIDLDSSSVRATIATGDRVAGVNVTADSQQAVVANSDQNTVSIIDLNTDTVVRTLNVSTRPWHVAMSPTSNTAAVLTVAGTDLIHWINVNGAASSVIGTTIAGQTGNSLAYTYAETSGITFNPSGSILAVCRSFDDQLRLIDANTRAVITDVTVGDFPIAVAFSPDGTRAYVTNTFSNNVSVVQINGASSTTIATIPGFNSPLFPVIDPAGQFVYINNQGTNPRVSVVSTTTNSIVANVTLSGGNPRDLALAPDGNLYVAGADTVGGWLYVLSAAGAATAVTDSIALSASPFDLALAPGRDLIAISQPIPDGVDLVNTGEPCDGDVNCDFALDGFDVEVQEKAVGGDMTDYCQPDPDFNGDFALDGFDVEAVEIVVGGGPCP